MFRTSRLLQLLVLSAFVSATAIAQTAKRPLDHDVYDSWNSIRGQTLSDDGRWLAYSVGPAVGDGKLHIVSVADPTNRRELERGTSPRFIEGSRYLLVTVVPPREETEAARRDRRRAEEQPRNTLTIVTMATGETIAIGNLRDYRTPETGLWISYRLHPPAPPSPPAQRQEPREEQEEEKPEGRQKKRNHTLGSEVVLRNLADGREVKIPFVSEFQWAKDGSYFVYSVSARNGEGDGLYVYETATAETKAIAEGIANYRQITIHEDTGQIAFLSDTSDYEADAPASELFLWNGTAARVVAPAGSAGIPEGWRIADRGSLRFSESGKRLFFRTAPNREAAAANETPEDERVTVDVWNWRDPLLQPMQLVQANTERNRTYEAVVFLSDGRLLQLENQEMRSVTVGAKAEADVGVGTDGTPYQPMISWDGTYNDVYLIDLRDGSRRRLLEQASGSVSLSPSARFAIWYDREEAAWFAMDAASGAVRNISSNIPYAMYDELDDRPMLPGSYGTAGWTHGEEALLINDRYDVWAVDPAGRLAPKNITGGLGRTQEMRLRIVRLNREEETIASDEPLLLSAFNERTKQEGFYRVTISGSARPQRVVMEDASLSNPTKAKDADVLLFTRQTFQEFPDLYVSDLDFSNRRRMSDANPQQSEFLWGTAELVHWRSTEGEPLQGVLYKPEDFDPAKKYPMIVYFYERLSQNLNRHFSVGPGSSSISIPFYVSRGYVIFTPDIPYTEGYPGQSAMNAIMPGVLSIVDRGFVDPARIGLQGHSWGGYQISYMITRTNMFACAEAGAPVSNMISAYGGIRWQTGMSRQFQYEKTQSRIGGTIWERPLQYIENSPVFWADRVNTPLLMLHNDEDGAVPWYQGIEYFTALRRLGKPVWMLNYNGEGHGLSRRQNQKDWAIRMQQFFDHYLMGAPMPVWMARGVPAVDKGRDLGLDPSGGG